MSNIQIETRSGATSRSIEGKRSASSQTGLNRVLAWALIAMLALSPLPFGSIYGFTWGFFAFYVGIAAMIYIVSLAQTGESLRVPLSSMAVQVGLFCLLAVYLIVQMLPLGAIFGGFAITSGGSPLVTGNSLSISPDMTLLMLVRQLTYGLFFFLVLQVTQNGARRRFFLDAMLVIILAYAALSVVLLQTGDTVLGIPKTVYQGSATGPFVNRNSFATFLAFGAILALAQIGRRIIDQSERHPHDGWVPGLFSTVLLYSIAYVVLVGVAFATQSRMGVLVTLSGSALVAVFVAFRSLRSWRSALLLVLGSLVAIAAAFLLFGEGLVDRLFDVERSQNVRADLYYQVLELIGMRPLTGFGGGTFELAFPLVHDAPVSVDYVWDKAHNTYLTLWAELGLVAGSIPMILLAWAGWRLLTQRGQSADGWVARTVALAALLIAGLHSLVDFSLEIQANTFVFLALIATGVTTTMPARGT